MGAAGWTLRPTSTFAAQQDFLGQPAISAVGLGRDLWNDWPAYLADKMNQVRAKRLAALAAIRSVPEARERTTMIRSKLWELIGGPLEKSPLNAQITGQLERPGYRIEKIVFESIPQVYVTANLYIPTLGKPPFPAILAPLGHAPNGKAYRNYQYLYQNLARQGYVVLAYDPWGQGERRQYISSEAGRAPLGPTGEHTRAGRPMVLLGGSLALYLAWDGIRGLDYLVGRPEVHPDYLGCTGHSGGGTMTMYLAALEPRIRAAVVVEGNSENVAGRSYDPPGAVDDAEQDIVGGLPWGLDRGDLLCAFAPKPLLICYTTHDVGETYSPVYEEETREIFRDVQDSYVLFGKQNQVQLYSSHLPHDLDFFCRRQTYAWFNQWLKNGEGNTDENDFDAFPEELLNATTTGQVLTSLGGRSVVQVNSARIQEVLPESIFANAPPVGEEIQQNLRDELIRLLALPKLRLPLNSIVLSSNRRKNVVIEEFQFQSQPGMRVPGWFLRPWSSGIRHPTILYLDDEGGEGIVDEPGSMDDLLAEGFAICSITPRGLGITSPRTPRAGPNYYQGRSPLDQRFAWASLVLGEPVVGQRVWDILRSIDYLASRSDVDSFQISILGTKNIGLAAQMAACLDKRPKAVLLDRTLVSYASLVESDEYSLGLPWFVPGILRRFDLPDISAAIGPRPCWIMNGVNPSGAVLSESSVREEYRRRINEGSSASKHLRFIVEPEKAPQQSYLAWAKHT
jgi:cephalosporin-C deacetylase-like acetyl esterase